MQPIEPTSESLHRLDRHGHVGLREQLLGFAEQVQAVVPSVTGFSLTKLDADGTPLTLVATSDDLLTLDTMQYLDGGPCVEAVRSGTTIFASDSDPLNEQRWSWFSRATAAEGVLSSLSLPLTDLDRVVGGVNIYASAVNAFDEVVPAVADVLGTWASDAVRDADLTFSARLRAVETSRELARRDDLVDRAVAVVARLRGSDLEHARRDLRDAAAKTGVSEHEVARSVLLFHT